MELGEKLGELKRLLAGVPGLVVGLSGGVDSALIASVGMEVLSDRCHALIARIATAPPGEFEGAVELAREIGIRYEVVEHNNLLMEEVRRNQKLRCLHCKEGLIRLIRGTTEELLAFGETTTDMDSYRPGREAAREHGVWFPLVEAGLSKSEVRELARQRGLSVWDRPSEACLASRFPYGTELEPPLLRRVAEAEAVVKALGIRVCRVRCHGEIARIEVDPEHMATLHSSRTVVADRFIGLGFGYVAMDLRGYRTGSMDAGPE